MKSKLTASGICHIFNCHNSQDSPIKNYKEILTQGLYEKSKKKNFIKFVSKLNLNKQNNLLQAFQTNLFRENKTLSTNVFILKMIFFNEMKCKFYFLIKIEPL